MRAGECEDGAPIDPMHGGCAVMMKIGLYPVVCETRIPHNTTLTAHKTLPKSQLLIHSCSRRSRSLALRRCWLPPDAVFSGTTQSPVPLPQLTTTYTILLSTNCAAMCRFPKMLDANARSPNLHPKKAPACVRICGWYLCMYVCMYVYVHVRVNNPKIGSHCVRVGRDRF